MLIKPLPIATIAGRGTGIGNLLTADPKEVWVDSDAGGSAVLTIDLGAVATIDTVFLGSLRQAAAGSVWSITAGLARADEFTIQAATALRVPDVSGQFAPVSHALAFGTSRSARYLRISITQVGGAVLSAGALVIGKAFIPVLGQEWGAGRRPIDTGTATALPSGGFSVVKGVRKRGLTWTFGDLSLDEVDQLETLALDLGETAAVLVVEDPARTAGLLRRIHYAKFDRWKAFERRNRAQTRWEISVEEWV